MRESVEFEVKNTFVELKTSDEPEEPRSQSVPAKTLKAKTKGSAAAKGAAFVVGASSAAGAEGAKRMSWWMFVSTLRLLTFPGIATYTNTSLPTSFGNRPSRRFCGDCGDEMRHAYDGPIYCRDCMWRHNGWLPERSSASVHPRPEDRGPVTTLGEPVLCSRPVDWSLQTWNIYGKFTTRSYRCCMAGDGPSALLTKRLKVNRPSKLGSRFAKSAAPSDDRKGVGAGGKLSWEDSKVRDLKRGARAWENFHAVAEDVESAGERLLIHSVSDDTALKSYIPAVRKFFTWAAQRELPCGTWSQLDTTLLKYLGWLAYCDGEVGRHPAQGSLVVNGLCWLFPDASRELPLAWRASRGYAGFSITHEGSPTALQRLACMVDELQKLGTPESLIAADMIVVAPDGNLREQDMVQLRVRDLVFSGSTVALLLGRSEKGESFKTGRDQGVVMDEPISFQILQDRVKGKSPNDKVFGISGARYRYWWHWAAKAVTGSSAGAGPPHSARHTGASRDLSEGYRTLEEVMKRGRWKSLQSVHRYAKPHIWYAAIAALSPEEKARGDSLLASRSPRPAR